MENTFLPLVSVGIPTFNRSSSLKKAVESVLHQTYPNIQLIISDNASTDDTQSVCENFSGTNERIIYIRQKANLGATNNFVEVLKSATGEYYMWLADDDWIDKSYISECVSILIDNPEYSLVSGKPQYFINGDFKYQGTLINLEQEDGGSRLLCYYSQISDNGIFHGVMRRDQISKIPFENTMGGDWLMIAAISFLGKIKTIPSTAINRELKVSNTDGYSFEDLAARLGVSKLQGKHPMFSICISAIKDIWNNNQVISSVDKINIGTRIVFIFIRKSYSLTLRPKIVTLLAVHTPKLIYLQIRSIYRLLKRILSGTVLKL